MVRLFRQSGETGKTSEVTTVPLSIIPARAQEFSDLEPGYHLVQVNFASGATETQSIVIEPNASAELEFGDRDDTAQIEEPVSTGRSEIGELPIVFEGTRGILLDDATDARVATFEALGNDALEFDLTKIRGVGPVLARAMMERGIASVQDVAMMSERDMAWLGQSAKSLRPILSRYEIAKGAAELLDASAGIAAFGTVSGSGGPNTKSDGTIGFGRAGASQTGFGVAAADVGRGFTPGMAGIPVGIPASDETLLSSLEPQIWDYSALEQNTPHTSFEAVAMYGSMKGSGTDWGQISDLIASDKPPDASEVANSLIHASPTASVDLVTAKDGHNQILTGTILASDLIDISEEEPPDQGWTIIDDGAVTWLAVLPAPWRSADNQSLCDLSLLIDRSDECATMVDVKPVDVERSNLLAFLQRGDSRTTMAILEQANEALFKKFDNPLAAVAGGLALINARRWNVNQDSALARVSQWSAWLDNLAYQFPWIPDGAILKAWDELLGSEGDRDAARASLLDAFGRGIPYYSACFKLLLDGLRAVRWQDETAIEQVDKALLALEPVSLRIDPQQVFTTIRLSRYASSLSD